MEQLLEEQKRTNELLKQLINQNEKVDELLTIEQIHDEFNIGVNTIRKMFNDSELAVQKYTVPFKVKRGVLLDYMNTRHDYLCEA